MDAQTVCAFICGPRTFCQSATLTRFFKLREAPNNAKSGPSSANQRNVMAPVMTQHGILFATVNYIYSSIRLMFTFEGYKTNDASFMGKKFSGCILKLGVKIDVFEPHFAHTFIQTSILPQNALRLKCNGK